MAPRASERLGKLAPIRESFGEHFANLELVEADLMNEESLVNAIAGSTYVAHIASPFFISQNEEDLIPPAVNGTTAVIKGCAAAGVRRCVITSSLAAVNIMANADKPANKTYNESHWSNPNRPEPTGAYFKSKMIAEKTAWDLVAALPEV